MKGAILGDIIGSRFEGSNNKNEEFKLFHKDCCFTDDTIMTIATADAIINNKSFKDAYLEWGTKFPDRGYGGNFNHWLKSDNPQPYNSYGNGSAMRVSPVGWLYNDLQTVITKAEESAMCTHNHVDGIKGASSVAVCIYLARKKTDKDTIKNTIESFYGYDLSRKLEEIKQSYEFDVTCQGSVPESIICFLEGTSYEDTIRKAIGLGGDTDTMGAIAGSIAEAYYGIPDKLVWEIDKFLEYNDSMLDIIVQFNKAINPFKNNII